MYLTQQIIIITIEIKEENINWIKKAYDEKGIITVIATGIPLDFVKKLCKLHSNCFANYIIACNGAIVHNNNTNEHVYTDKLTTEFIFNKI